MQVLDGFVVLEGLDGAGTTTQLQKLDRFLNGKGKAHLVQAEPTDGPIGRLIRDVLQHKHSVQPWTLAMLYAADRNEHVARIEQEIAGGNMVVCDRYLYSSLAYQGVTCPWEDVWTLNQHYPHPSTILYIDTPVEECMERISHRGEPVELFEHQEFLTKVRDGYERAFSHLPAGVRMVRLDGAAEPEEIFRKICQVLPD